MNILVPTTLFGWLPAILLLFAIMPPRRAVLVSFIVAWLFLPVAGYNLPGLPDYTKMNATCVGVLLGVALFDASRLMAFRASFFDIPMLVWCVCPMASSYFNGLGLYDGASGIMNYVIIWGLPYFIGRLYFNDADGLRDLAIGLFFGALIYIPFCLYEIKMSPYLHKLVYGQHQHSFGQTKRGGGFRPMVFMIHGIMVGFWMISGTIIGFWLWFCGIVRKVWIFKMSMLLVVLLITAVLCKSTGATVLMIGGMGMLLGCYYLRTRLILAVFLMLPVIYIGGRIQGWQAAELVSIVEEVSDERAASLQFRIDAEILLVERALMQPVFGWGGWSRSRVTDQRGRDIAVTDSMWIIAIGQRGLVGLIAYFTALLLPGFILLKRYPPHQWRDPAIGSLVALTTVVTLFAYDSAFNAMINPIFLVVLGGLIGAAQHPDFRRSNRMVFTPIAKEAD